MEFNGCTKMMSDEAFAKKALEEKYGIPFEIEEIQQTHLFDEYFTVIAYPEDDPELLFQAHIDSDGENFSDNYVSRLISQNISEQIEENLDSLPGFYYVVAAELSANERLSDSSISVSEYLESNPENDFNVYLFYCPDNENNEADIPALYNGISQMFNNLNGINGMVYLYIGEERFIKDVHEYSVENDMFYDDFDNWADSKSVGYFQFVNGEIQISADKFRKMAVSN